MERLLNIERPAINRNSDRRQNCDCKRLVVGNAPQIPEVQEQHWSLGENSQRIRQQNSPSDLITGSRIRFDGAVVMIGKRI